MTEKSKGNPLGKPVTWKGRFHQCGKIPLGEKRKACFLDLSEFAEIRENFLDAAEASEAGGNSERANRMWIKYAEEMASKGYYWDAAFAYRLAGDEEKFKKMLNIEIKKEAE